MLNLGSILLGLCAWGVPLYYLSRRVKNEKRSGWPFVVSLGCCGTSLWFQLLYQSHLAAIGDVSAWMDTADAVAKVAGFLLAATLLLNAVTAWLDGRMGMEETEDDEA